MIRKYFIFTVVACAVALAAGAVYVQKLPATNHNKFSSTAADYSQVPFDEVSRARVDAVLQNDQSRNSHYSQLTENLQVTFLTGSDKGKQTEVYLSEQLTDPKLQEVKAGDVIVVGKISQPDVSYVFLDRYRLPYLAYFAAGFLLLALVFGRWRGLTSIIGLGASIAILVLFLAPNIVAGKNATLVTLVSAGAIALISMFFAHGFKNRTLVAIISTLFTLGLAELLAYFSLIPLKLIGNGSEEAFYLQQGFLGSVDLRGLLLGGIIIGTLGILNDITTAQSAAVEEIYQANPKLSLKELYQKGISVGREHIASLINTLVLVYVGASLPLFLLLLLTSNHQFWVVLNSEALAEEIVRTLVGSIALTVAVPITTALAAYFFTKNIKPEKPGIPDADDYSDNARERIN